MMPDTRNYSQAELEAEIEKARDRVDECVEYGLSTRYAQDDLNTLLNISRIRNYK